MSELQAKIARLSPAQRQLLELRRKAIVTPSIAVKNECSIPLRANRNTAPLSNGQQRFWLAAQIDPCNPTSNTTRNIRFIGPLDADRLCQALTQVVARHDILRTTYVRNNISGDAIQWIHPPADVTMPVIDLSHLPPDAQEAAARAFAANDARKPFDLNLQQVFRVSLLRMAADRHVLAMTIHHIAFDGWSVGIFQRDLMTAYTTICQRGAALTPLDVQYADFAAWQASDVASRPSAIDEAYWKDHLADLTPLDLPADRPRLPVQSDRGARKTVHFSPALTDRLKAFSRSRQATLFTTLLAGFNVLLHRYSGSRDVVIGSQVAGRDRVECEPMIGFFVDTIMLRTSFDGNPTFGDIVDRVRAEMFGAMKHDSVAYEDLIRLLAPPRDPSRHELFQVAFQLRNFPKQEARSGELTAESFEYDNGIAVTDLHVMAAERDGGIEVSFDYCVDLYDAATIDRMAAHYETILNVGIANETVRIADITLLSVAEQKRVLNDWNATDRHFDLTLGVHDRIAEGARQTPDAIAARYDGDAISYRALDERANQLAHVLIKQNVHIGDRVGLCCTGGIDLAVGLLGILKAGAAFLLLDPKYPAARINTMLAAATPAAVVTLAALRDAVRAFTGPVIALDTDAEWIRDQSTGAPHIPVSGDDLAYVMFTSGSTGEPNGVMIPHRALLNHNRAAIDLYGLTHVDRVLQFSSLGFDLSLEEMFPTWLVGGAVVFMPPELPISGTPFIQFCDSEGITVLDLPTAYWHAWVQQLAVDERMMPTTLRAVIVGGEKASAEVYRTWLRHGGNRVRFFNTYGPTETTIIATAYEPPIKADQVPHNLPIGRPIANTQVYVLDKGLNPQPIGVPGELYIGGHGLADGYLNRPELTAQRFITHVDLGRLYKTGDLCRWLATGELEILGRADGQVKIRGFRIEPGEIEAALQRHPLVNEAVVVTIQNDRGEKDLVAYVTARDAAVLSHDALKRHIAGSLPNYMVPTHVVTLERLPLTANGKIDLRALPSPQPTTIENNAEPHSPTEHKLAAIWCEILQTARVGRHDDFFALGGHSLRAVLCIARIQKTFGIEIATRTIFDAPRLHALAKRIDEQLAAAVPASPINPPTDESRPAPLSPAQRRMWFLSRFETDVALYNVNVARRLKGHVDIVRLESAFNEVIRRHDVLRTRFVEIDGLPNLDVTPPDASIFSVGGIDLSHLADLEQQERTQQTIATASAAGFDLTQLPLLRATLIQLGKDEFILALTLHHIVCDEWSIGILFDEVSAFYNADRSSTLPSLAVQYGDFSRRQDRWLESDACQASLAYWKQQLDAAPSFLPLPTDFPRPATQTYRGARQQVAIADDTARKLRELGQSEGATSFMTGLALFDLLLMRWTRQRDIVIGTPIANRSRAEHQGLIGVFLNTLPIRLQAQPDSTFRDLLRQSRHVSLDAFSNQELPFERLIEAVNPPRSPSHAPIFQVMFVLTSESKSTLTLNGVTSSPMNAHNGGAKFELTLFLSEIDGRLTGTIEYNTDLFSPATISDLAQQLALLADTVVATPDASIQLLCAPSGQERERLLHDFNPSRIEKAGGTVLDLFAEQARTTPSTVAVMMGSRQMTYAELDMRSDALAGELLRRGISREARVGIYMSRSIEMIAALLGVMKAGAAYVPLDPAYPVARLATMISDAGATIILSESALATAELLRGATVIALDRDWPAPSNEPLPCVEPDQLAYVLYTSGSTGKPKGVAVPHGPAWHLARWQREHSWNAIGTRTLQFTSLNFDVSFQEIFSTFCAGGTLILIDDVTRRDPDALLLHVCDAKIERLFLPFVALQGLAEAATKPNAPRPSLREVITAGEQLRVTPAVVEWFSSMPACKLVNQYGPTETHVINTALELTGDPHTWPALPTIGRPIDSARLYVLDDDRRLLPIGTPGELYIGGECLARGYLTQPELTAAAFVTDPFYDEPGARMYRTGDLARWLRDGMIEYLGRCDQQVKVQGYRIELGEVESVISRFSGVKQVAVVPRSDGRGLTRLIAYVVSDTPPDVKALRLHVGATLPAYMVPSAFVPLAKLPLTSSNKINRSALPDPIGLALESENQSRPPENDAERHLVDIWQTVLALKKVSVHDNFFDIGGQSLLAVRVFAEIEKRFGKKIPLSLLFSSPTIAQLAPVLIDASTDEVDDRIVIPLQPRGTRPPIFCLAGINGHVFSFRTFAAQLGDDQPVYGLQVEGLESGKEPMRRIEEIAAFFIAHVRRLQPAGPYALIGYSFGGTVAYEMAQQLVAAGERVELIGMLDTFATFERQMRPLRDRVRIHAKRIFTGGISSGPRYLFNVGRRIIARFRPDQPRFKIASSASADPAVTAGIRRVRDASEEALNQYRPRPLDGTITLFQATEQPSWEAFVIPRSKNGWDVFASRVDVWRVAGTHLTMLDAKGAKEIAAIVAQQLNRDDARAA